MIFHVALDPAKPWFDLTDATNKVSKEDATLVDVVHTNSGFLLYVSYKIPSAFERSSILHSITSK